MASVKVFDWNDSSPHLNPIEYCWYTVGAEIAKKKQTDSLEWLKLGGNEIESVPSLSFYNLSRLRQLDLRCNRITIIEEDAFVPFGKTLKFIFFQKNSIRTIESQALTHLKSVEWLYLHSNELKFLPYSTFKPVIDNLHVLDLHGNPFHCDCDILWFKDWLHEKGANIVNLPKETRCKSPPEISQVPVVRLTNSSFSCSAGADVTHRLTNKFFFIFLLWVTSLVFHS